MMPVRPPRPELSAPSATWAAVAPAPLTAPSTASPMVAGQPDADDGPDPVGGDAAGGFPPEGGPAGGTLPCNVFSRARDSGEIAETLFVPIPCLYWVSSAPSLLSSMPPMVRKAPCSSCGDLAALIVDFQSSISFS